MGDLNIWVQTGDSLPNGRALFYKALCRLRGTFAGDKDMVVQWIPRLKLPQFTIYCLSKMPGGGGGGTHCVRHTGVCRSNRSLF